MSITFLNTSRPVGEDGPVNGRVEIIMDGKPAGKGRPRFGAHGHVYTPKPTKLAEARIIDAWLANGSPRLDGAIHLSVALVVARPQSHLLKSGALNAAGRRKPYPTGKKPDLDNACKLAMDALNGRLYRDDVDVVELFALRYWSDDGWERTIMRAWSLPA